MEDKDRFGDKLRQKEKADEDRYFADQDRKRLERLRSAKGDESEAQIREIARGRCPKCGVPLTQRAIGTVEIDECPECGGMWLDKGELDELPQGDQESWLGNFTRVLLRPVR